MNNKAKTEEEMRATEVQTPNTKEELSEYIDSLISMEHDYGTCVYAMSMAAEAAFRFVSRKLGVTGFQASCADLDFIRRTRRLDCPFMIIKAENMLYPQYNILKDVKDALFNWRGWAAKEAKKKLVDVKNPHPNVKKRWEQLAKEDDDVGHDD